MTASIVITGLANDDPVPGVYVQENFAAGPSTGSGASRRIVVLANPLPSGGTATKDTVIYGPNSPVPLNSEADMIALAGAGSPAHRMFLRITDTGNTVTPIDWVFVTPSAGTAASGTVTIATTATGNGVHRLWVGDDFCDTSIATGDTVTTIAAAIAANVNAKTDWPVTASPAVGVVTLTAKVPGPRGNWIRFMAQITASIGSTTTATADAFLTSGATADSNTAALATILPKRYYYIVSEAEDATQVGALVSQVSTAATPIIGLTQRVFYGSSDTLSNVTTIATGVNAVRSETQWQEKSTWTPGELAANFAAVAALFESNEDNPRTNFAGFGNDATTQQYWKVPRSRVDSAAPTRAALKSALNNGISPIAVSSNGATYLVNRITNRSLTGSTPDYRIRDSHKVTICDFFSDKLKTKATLQYGGKRIADDPPKGSPPPGPEVVTPGNFKTCIFGLLNDLAENDLLQNLQDIKDATVVQREGNPPTRMTARIPLEPIDNLYQIGVSVDQVA